MANKHNKRHLTSSIIEEIYIKSIRHSTYPWMTPIKKTDDNVLTGM